MLVRDIVKIMEETAPPELAEKWDNVGLLVGDEDSEVKKILFALDAIDPVVDEAIEIGADMIITHHPIIFKSINAVNNTTSLGRRIIKLIKNNISVYSAHTNFDIADGGTNSILADLIGLRDTDGLIPCGDAFLGRTGIPKEKMTLKDLADKLMDVLGAPSLNITGELSHTVCRVGLCTGSGADRDFMLAAKQKDCDVYITGDVSYHNAQFAQEIGLCLIDAAHYYTEAAAMPYLCGYVSEKCTVECVVTKIKGESFKLITR